MWPLVFPPCKKIIHKKANWNSLSLLVTDFFSALSFWILYIKGAVLPFQELSWRRTANKHSGGCHLLLVDLACLRHLAMPSWICVLPQLGYHDTTTFMYKFAHSWNIFGHFRLLLDIIGHFFVQLLVQFLGQNLAICGLHESFTVIWNTWNVLGIVLTKFR